MQQTTSSSGPETTALTAGDVEALKRAADAAEVAFQEAQAAELRAAGGTDDVLERAIVDARKAQLRAEHARARHTEAAATLAAQEQAEARRDFEEGVRATRDFMTEGAAGLVAKLVANEKERRALLRGPVFAAVLEQNALRAEMPAKFARLKRDPSLPRNVATMWPQQAPLAPADVLAYAVSLVAREDAQASHQAYLREAQAREAAERANAASQPSHPAAAVHAVQVASEEQAEANEALVDAEAEAQRHQADHDTQAARAAAFERVADARRALAVANERMTVVQTPLQLAPEVA